MSMYDEARGVESPISFEGHTSVESNVGLRPQVHKMSHNADLWSGYQGRLRYDFEKLNMSMAKQDFTFQQKLNYERELKELKIRYHNYLKMSSCSVYMDSEGNIIYAITNPENENIASKRLLNVGNYHSKIFKTYYPEMVSALQVEWDGKGNNSLTFILDSYGVDPNTFLKKLKAKGVLFLVSGRSEKQAANALLAYSFNAAEHIEISGNHGWNKLKNGSWHYAGDGEITMQEVVKNACK